jgi:hypothetical protein
MYAMIVVGMVEPFRWNIFLRQVENHFGRSSWQANGLKMFYEFE